MPKRTAIIKSGNEKIGVRISKFRKLAGLTQRELAAELSISQRMIAYYEKHAETLPAHLLLDLAKTLGVSAEQILGNEEINQKTKLQDSRLWRRFKEVEKLPSDERRQIVRLLDTFIEKEKLRRSI